MPKRSVIAQQPPESVTLITGNNLAVVMLLRCVFVSAY